MALIACARRDLVRDARFLGTIFLSAIRSMTACDACSVFAAAVLSPAPMDFFTFLTAVRSADFMLALRLRVCSACRARLRACAELAMDCVPKFDSRISPRLCRTIAPRYGCGYVCRARERPRIIRDFSCRGNAIDDARRSPAPGKPNT